MRSCSGKGVGQYPCISCGRAVTVWYRSRSSTGSRGSTLWFTCQFCSAGTGEIGTEIPGLPSDTSYLRRNWRSIARDARTERRRKLTQQQAIRRRAETLLRGYLSAEQARTYDDRRVITVRSPSVAGLSYELSETDNGARITALVGSGTRGPDFRPPGLADATIRRFADRFRSGTVPLCLHPTGGLPPADQVLALKLFIETDERRAWQKGTRMIRGLPPEPDPR